MRRECLLAIACVHAIAVGLAYPVDSAVTAEPDGAISETDEDNNEAAMELPVVIPGRGPQFPWYHQTDHLRWATAWAG